MSFEDSIAKYPNNFVGFTMADKKYNIIEVRLPYNYSEENNEEGIIVKKNKNTKDTWYFLSEKDKKSIVDLWNYAIKIIEINNDIELKRKLFMEKKIEMATIFSNTTYEKLKKLSFTFRKNTSNKNKGEKTAKTEINLEKDKQ
jgi:hypothetical protein